MSEVCTYEKQVIDPELRERRLLNASEHLMAAMRPNGRIPQDVLDDVELNLETAVYELAMPLASFGNLPPGRIYRAKTGSKRKSY